jgi:hypothetical protein
MEKQDNLFKYMKELPNEEPSDDFTRRVMDRVRTEAIKTPAFYQPLISRQAWAEIFIGMIMLIIVSALINGYFPANNSPSWFSPLSKIDFSFIFIPFVSLSKAMNNLPITVVAGLMAISMLLLIDQLFYRYGNR